MLYIYIYIYIYINREAGTARAGDESSQSINIHTYNLCIPIIYCRHCYSW